MKTCIKCRTENWEEARYCGFCGTLLEEKMQKPVSQPSFRQSISKAKEELRKSAEENKNVKAEDMDYIPSHGFVYKYEHRFDTAVDYCLANLTKPLGGMGELVEVVIGIPLIPISILLDCIGLNKRKFGKVISGELAIHPYFKEKGFAFVKEAGKYGVIDLIDEAAMFPVPVVYDSIRFIHPGEIECKRGDRMERYVMESNRLTWRKWNISKKIK